MPLVVAAPDKLRGTATAPDVAAAIARGAAAAGWDCIQRPVADGGEGTLDVFGGPNRMTRITGPLGDPVDAQWRLDGRVAVIEMARASGLEVIGGADENDPVAASTAGTGELLATAIDNGARRLLVGLGGSATTDGGLGAVRTLYPLHRLRSVELLVLCDVRTRFVDAAEVFASQKGASAAQVELLRRRLERLAEVYLEDHGVDVRELEGAGAAGGLAGGLAAIGGELIGGFDAIAEEIGLADDIDEADLVVTAEGFVDEQSFDGKVVGGVAALAQNANVRCITIAGEVLAGLEPPVPNLEMISLVERFGSDRAHNDPLGCIERTLTELGPATGSIARSRRPDDAARRTVPKPKGGMTLPPSTRHDDERRP